MKKSMLIGIIIFGVIVVGGIILGVSLGSSNTDSTISDDNSGYYEKDSKLKVDFDELTIIKTENGKISLTDTIEKTGLNIYLASTDSITPKMDDAESVTIKANEGWSAQLELGNDYVSNIHARGKNETGKVINIKEAKLDKAIISIGGTESYEVNNIIDKEFNFTFAKDIKLGKSTVADVEKAYGVEATYDSFEEFEEILISSSDYSKSVKFRFVNDRLVEYYYFGD